MGLLDFKVSYFSSPAETTSCSAQPHRLRETPWSAQTPQTTMRLPGRVGMFEVKQFICHRKVGMWLRDRQFVTSGRRWLAAVSASSLKSKFCAYRRDQREPGFREVRHRVFEVFKNWFNLCKLSLSWEAKKLISLSTRSCPTCSRD